MAKIGTITSANAVLMIGVTGLPNYTVATQLQGFMADAAFAADDVDLAEVVIGVDGYIAGGWIPQLNQQTISIQAGSPSEDLFEQWKLAENAAEEKMLAFGTLQLPSVGKKYTLSNGFLMRFSPHAEGRKTLQGRAFRITWGSITPAAI